MLTSFSEQSEKRLVLAKLYKPSFLGKAYEPSRAELFEPKSEPSRAKNEPSLGSGATLIFTNKQ